MSNQSNKKYHFVASQDKDLRATIAHTVAGIPLIYFNQGPV
jgi:rRNA-processing protein FCF1